MCRKTKVTACLKSVEPENKPRDIFEIYFSAPYHRWSQISTPRLKNKSEFFKKRILQNSIHFKIKLVSALMATKQLSQLKRRRKIKGLQSAIRHKTSRLVLVVTIYRIFRHFNFSGDFTLTRFDRSFAGASAVLLKRYYCQFYPENWKITSLTLLRVRHKYFFKINRK